MNRIGKVQRSNRRKLFWITLYSFYVIFILLSLSAYYAEYTINTRATGTHSYVLTFKYIEGEDTIEKEHYVVKLVEKSEIGKIWVTYYADSHELDVRTSNILELTIDARSMAEEKSNEVLGIDSSGYKDYFIQKNLFIVNVDSDHDIKLILLDVPIPTSVKNDGESVEFTYSKGRVTTMVPEGNSKVDIKFETTGKNLVADFITENSMFYHLPDKPIRFDASASSPADEITDYIWDFGDGYFGSEKIITHSYVESGIYRVTLVVRDNDGNINRVTEDLYVNDEDGDDLPDDWEVEYFNNVIPGKNDDQDSDGLNNGQEYLYNTDPTNSDTDGDEYPDGKETEKGTDPTDPTDKPTEKKDKTEEGFDPMLLAIIAVIVIIIILLILSVLIRRGKESEVEEYEAEEEAEIAEGYEEAEEEEAFTCPECGSVIEEDQPECYDCGATLEWEEEEIEEEQKVSGMEDESGLGSLGLEEKDELYEEGDYEAKEDVIGDTDEKGPEKEQDLEEEEEYECPTCGGIVSENDIVCPNCGEEFE